MLFIPTKNESDELFIKGDLISVRTINTDDTDLEWEVVSINLANDNVPKSFQQSSKDAENRKFTRLELNPTIKAFLITALLFNLFSKIVTANI